MGRDSGHACEPVAANDMKIGLPPAPWQQRTGLAHLLDVLGASEDQTRYVGGAVRDTILGLGVQDVDLATKLPPDEVLTRLKAAQIKAVPTGLAHGTVTAVLPDGPIEITTLRRDIATDGRHATIAYTDDWQADAARRDFTINALFANPKNGEIYDYFAGLADLNAGRVAFIGDPLTRIAEDHLRILRFFRFHARFGRGVPDATALAACGARANDLMALSRERIADELLKILSLPNPLPTVVLMVEHGIFVPVLPEITSTDGLVVLIKSEADAGAPAAPLRRLAALLAPDPVLTDRVGARLKLSKAQRKHLALLGARQATDAESPRALAYYVGIQAARDRLLLSGHSTSQLNHWTPPKLPLSGGALVSRGLTVGPKVAAALHDIEDAWVKGGFAKGAALEAIIADAVLRWS